MRLGWRHGPNLLLGGSAHPQLLSLLLCNDQRDAARHSWQGLCWLRRNQTKILLKALPQAFEVVIQDLLLFGVTLDRELLRPHRGLASALRRFLIRVRLGRDDCVERIGPLVDSRVLANHLTVVSGRPTRTVTSGVAEGAA
jgi:hypothetical protein